MKTNYKIKKLKQKDYLEFYESLKRSREQNNHGLFVLLRNPEEYKYTKNFLMQHSIGGFAITPDGEFISVHKNNALAKIYNAKHILPQLVECAIKNGATKGDCYGEFLASYYMQCGFVVVAKVPFVNVYDNPKNWDYNTFGKPYVFILAKAVFNNSEYDNLCKNNSFVHFSEIAEFLPEFKNYDYALEYRDKLLEKFKAMSYTEVVDFIKESNKHPNIERWQFGIDNDKLINLVLSGKKTATSCLYNKNEDIAKVGDLSIITTSNGKDACIIQTEEVIILPFYKMTWALAKLEGENETLEDWSKIHTMFFKTRNKNFNENTLIVFEKFKLVKKF